MRLASALALAATLASPALAQTQYADSSGGFVSVHELSLVGGSRGYGRNGVDIAAGYRRADGLDLSVRAGRFWGFGAATRLGFSLGLTRQVGAGVQGRIEGTVQAVRGDTEGLDKTETGGLSPFAIRDRNVNLDLTATVARPVRLFGSVHLHPTLGLYGTTGTERRLVEGGVVVASDDLPVTRGGVHVALPLSFRLFGQTASFGPTVRFPLGDGFRFEAGRESAYAGGGLRLNF